MAIYRIAGDHVRPLDKTTFQAEGMLERQDLQRLFRQNIELLVPDAMVLAEEFGDWQDSRRRIDLLCLDRDAGLVVVELKRTEDGGHMELQAIRYAAMVSHMTFDAAVRAHHRFLGDNQSDLGKRRGAHPGIPGMGRAARGRFRFRSLHRSGVG